MVKLSQDNLSIPWIAIDWVTCRSIKRDLMGLMYSQAMASVSECVNASHAHVIGNNEKLEPGSMRELHKE